MRKFGLLKDMIVLLASVACAAALFLVWHLSSFAAGDSYTFYYGTSSSAIAETAEKALLKPRGTRGESTVYSEPCASRLLNEYRATVLFTEEACGVVNYYCYSPLLGEGVKLSGYTVNLHVAESEAQTAIGTPIIFGGY